MTAQLAHDIFNRGLWTAAILLVAAAGAFGMAYSAADNNYEFLSRIAAWVSVFLAVTGGTVGAIGVSVGLAVTS